MYTTSNNSPIFPAKLSINWATIIGGLSPNRRYMMKKTPNKHSFGLCLHSRIAADKFIIYHGGIFAASAATCPHNSEILTIISGWLWHPSVWNGSKHHLLADELNTMTHEAEVCQQPCHYDVQIA